MFRISRYSNNIKCQLGLIAYNANIILLKLLMDDNDNNNIDILIPTIYAGHSIS